MAKTITRTFKVNTFKVLLWDSETKSMDEKKEVNFDELNAEQFEKSIKKALKAAGDSRKVIEVELISSVDDLREMDCVDFYNHSRPAKRAEYIMNKDNG